MELFFCVLGVNLFFSYLLLHPIYLQYAELKNKTPPQKIKAFKCVPLNSFVLINLARQSGMRKISLKNPTDEGGNICSINITGEGSFQSVYRFISSLGCHQLQFLQLTQSTISMVVYGFCTCQHS